MLTCLKVITYSMIQLSASCLLPKNSNTHRDHNESVEEEEHNLKMITLFLLSKAVADFIAWIN